MSRSSREKQTHWTHRQRHLFYKVTWIDYQKHKMISYEDFAKVEIRAGKILSAEKIPDTDKLLKLSVDFAEPAPRQIVSGISLYFPDPQTLVGKTAMFVTNLEPRVIRGYESNGMLFAV